MPWRARGCGRSRWVVPWALQIAVPPSLCPRTCVPGLSVSLLTEGRSTASGTFVASQKPGACPLRGSSLALPWKQRIKLALRTCWPHETPVLHVTICCGASSDLRM
ncbi:hypothetical protein BD413DRAFT_512889 [Trametes elegans]|nr:hypothetical protein BD413DRAFT_512889 [Trametes elegans]